MTTVNFYDVLNIEADATRKEVKDAYKILVKEFHPDRPGGDEEMFELVTKAYNILSDPETRREYDKAFKLIRESRKDHQSLKEAAKNYYEAQDSGVGKKSKEVSAKEYEALFAEMDRKHNYRRGEVDVLTEQDTNRRLMDLAQAREQEDIELIQDSLLEPNNFNLGTFNAAFEAKHGSVTDLVPHVGNPDAWCGPVGAGGGMGTNYSSLDNYDNLYVDEGESNLGLDGQVYSSVHLDSRPSKKITAKDVKKLKPTSYTSDHNKLDKDYNKTLEEKIRERGLETSKLDSRTLGDYDTDPTCGGYGIFSELGMTNGPTIEWDDNANIEAKYKKLLEMRNSDN